METRNHLRFIGVHAHLATPFGPGWFGGVAERLARFFGTRQHRLGQSGLVALWVAANAAGWFHFDAYPFILLNLAFSLQAACAAPLILLAETRQAERDKHWTEAEAEYREDVARTTFSLLEQNTDLTREVRELSVRVQELTVQIHQRVVSAAPNS